MTSRLTRQRGLVRALSLTFLLTCVVPLRAASPDGEHTSRQRQECSECRESWHRRVVGVKIYNQPAIGDAGINRIVETANRIWNPYGVSIEPSAESDAIAVVVARTASQVTSDYRPKALGDTLFTDGHATPYIHLWPANAEALANASEMDGRTFTSRTRDEQHAILLQMLGVALAHELAHYLLDTSRHSAEGLLRQSIGVSELAFPNPGHLRLTTQQRQLLAARLGSLTTDHSS
jgi:hypothetical protein